MWIMIRTKLPTKIAPPKMSIFWSVPWPHEAWAKKQDIQTKKNILRHYDGPDTYLLEDGGDCFYGVFGKEPKWAGARKIIFKGENIRVFPHEFTEMSSEKMLEYIKEGVYEIVPDTVAEHDVINEMLRGTKKVLYEEALMDGCNEKEAMMTAMGIDFSGKFELPPIGWYRINEAYGSVFCTEEELSINKTFSKKLLI